MDSATSFILRVYVVNKASSPKTGLAAPTFQILPYNSPGDRSEERRKTRPLSLWAVSCALPHGDPVAPGPWPAHCPRELRGLKALGNFKKPEVKSTPASVY